MYYNSNIFVDFSSHSIMKYCSRSTVIKLAHINWTAWFLIYQCWWKVMKQYLLVIRHHLSNSIKYHLGKSWFSAWSLAQYVPTIINCGVTSTLESYTVPTSREVQLCTVYYVVHFSHLLFYYVLQVHIKNHNYTVSSVKCFSTYHFVCDLY